MSTKNTTELAAELATMEAEMVELTGTLIQAQLRMQTAITALGNRAKAAIPMRKVHAVAKAFMQYAIAASDLTVDVIDRVHFAPPEGPSLADTEAKTQRISAN